MFQSAFLDQNWHVVNSIRGKFDTWQIRCALSSCFTAFLLCRMSTIRKGLCHPFVGYVEYFVSLCKSAHDIWLRLLPCSTVTRYQMTLKRSRGRLEHRNRAAVLILELCGMREQGVWGVDADFLWQNYGAPLVSAVLKSIQKYDQNPGGRHPHFHWSRPTLAPHLQISHKSSPPT